MVAPNQVVIIPPPPRPPPGGEWTVDYGNQLNRWLENLARIVGGVNYGRFNGIYLASSFPTSGYGLYPGEVFANDGILTVVRPDDIWLGSFAVGAELGTLTVTV